jgi:TPR repeat protein
MAHTMMKTPISRSSNSTHRLVVPILLALLVAAPCHAGLREGLAAYDKADYATAQKELTPLAEKGDARAQSKLGRMYSLGQGVPNDSRAAAEWFLKAAEQGVAEAQGMLGYMYLVGDGAPQSNGKAYEWLRKAAEQGDAMAQYNLGAMFGGNGAKEDPVLAYMLYGLSAKNGHAEALKRQNSVAEKLTPAQKKEANDLMKSWKQGSTLPEKSKTGASPALSRRANIP